MSSLEERVEVLEKALAITIAALSDTLDLPASEGPLMDKLNHLDTIAPLKYGTEPQEPKL
jgi:hypothetical protein